MRFALANAGGAAAEMRCALLRRARVETSVDNMARKCLDGDGADNSVLYLVLIYWQL
jgi:hypothetical protein